MGYENLVGNKYGRLLVQKYAGKNKWNIATWECVCDCGGRKTVSSSQLKGGYTKSCGCISRERPSHTKHGGKGTRLYIIWKSMRGRCSTPSQKSFANYGGRNITICQQWDDYDCFRSWAMSHGYARNLTLDRIDVNGNYCPENCRWATLTQQARNTRKTIYYEINGQKKPFAEWVDEFYINYKLAYGRLRKGLFPFKNPKTFI